MGKARRPITAEPTPFPPIPAPRGIQQCKSPRYPQRPIDHAGISTGHRAVRRIIDISPLPWPLSTWPLFLKRHVLPPRCSRTSTTLRPQPPFTAVSLELCISSPCPFPHSTTHHALPEVHLGLANTGPHSRSSTLLAAHASRPRRPTQCPWVVQPNGGATPIASGLLVLVRVGLAHGFSLSFLDLRYSRFSFTS